MANLGTFILLAVFVICSYAAAASVAAPAADRAPRRERYRRVSLVTALMTVASAIIVHAFATNDYSIKPFSDTPTRRSRSSTS